MDNDPPEKEYLERHRSTLSAFDQVCVALKVPHSSEQWINQLIVESRKLDAYDAWAARPQE